ncbi:MAG: hypothetical protein FJZ01_14615 [Candidatus Sericytochromatia bacterium]|nr:hypothetical protein [Candidatus Tanganyikabacteria bacterium]
MEIRSDKLSVSSYDPASWQLSWQGHKGGSDDPEATQTAGKKPPPPPPATGGGGGGQLSVGPNATITWPNGFQDSTGGGYQAWFGQQTET